MHILTFQWWPTVTRFQWCVISILYLLKLFTHLHICLHEFVDCIIKWCVVCSCTCVILKWWSSPPHDLIVQAPKWPFFFSPQNIHPLTRHHNLLYVSSSSSNVFQGYATIKPAMIFFFFSFKQTLAFSCLCSSPPPTHPPLNTNH